MQKSIDGILVCGTHQASGGLWHAAQYLIRKERWFVLNIIGAGQPLICDARALAKVLSSHMRLIYIHDLTSEREVSIEDEILLVSPLELLGGTCTE